MRPHTASAYAFVFLSMATGCTSSSSSAGDGGGVGGEQCVTVDAGSSCMGEAITFCATQSADGSTCTSAHYQVGSRTVPCQSCSTADVEACGEQATMVCVGEAGGTGADATGAGADATGD
jgi:hypothetical protein